MKITKEEEPERYNIENMNREEFMLLYGIFNVRDVMIQKKVQDYVAELDRNFSSVEDAERYFKTFRDKLMDVSPYR